MGDGVEQVDEFGEDHEVSGDGGVVVDLAGGEHGCAQVRAAVVVAGCAEHDAGAQQLPGVTVEIVTGGGGAPADPEDVEGLGDDPVGALVGEEKGAGVVGVDAPDVVGKGLVGQGRFLSLVRDLVYAVLDPVVSFAGFPGGRGPQTAQRPGGQAQGAGDAEGDLPGRVVVVAAQELTDTGLGVAGAHDEVVEGEAAREEGVTDGLEPGAVGVTCVGGDRGWRPAALSGGVQGRGLVSRTGKGHHRVPSWPSVPAGPASAERAGRSEAVSAWTICWTSRPREGNRTAAAAACPSTIMIVLHVRTAASTAAVTTFLLNIALDFCSDNSNSPSRQRC
ncbi:hypothetical protein ACFQZ0_00345 [Streptomyces erythrogriseus]